MNHPLRSEEHLFKPARPFQTDDSGQIMQADQDKKWPLHADGGSPYTYQRVPEAGRGPEQADRGLFDLIGLCRPGSPDMALYGRQSTLQC